jgi:K(+)-stimulated pyrophosphate-energized sodium pump
MPKSTSSALNIGIGCLLDLQSFCYFLQYTSSNYEDGIFGEGSQDISSMRVFYATLIGLFVGGAISSVTEYYTGLGTKPVMAIVQNRQLEQGLT